MHEQQRLIQIDQVNGDISFLVEFDLGDVFNTSSTIEPHQQRVREAQCLFVDLHAS